MTPGLGYFFGGGLGHSRFLSLATRGHILVALDMEKPELSVMTSLLQGELQVGPSSRDVIYFMKKSSEDVLYFYIYTHYAGQTDTFECFLWGEDEDEDVEHHNCTSTSYTVERGRRLNSGSHSAELCGE